MIKVGIIGITGFAGLELLKILSSHSRVTLDYIASRSGAGKNVSDIYPQFGALISNKIEKIDINRIRQLDLVFLALPHTVSMEIVKDIYDYTKVVDLSADFRLSNVDTYEHWYKKLHTAKNLIKKSVYGLTEINREKIKSSDLVANPGCYATSVIIPLAPIINFVDKNSIIADSKSGISGAGRKAKEGMQFCDVNENFKAYSAANHRHIPEMEELLSEISDKEIKVTFTPHLLPIQRGILSTIYVNLNESLTKQDIYKLYDDFYEDSFFIRIKDYLPAINSVKGTNFCDIGFELDDRSNRLIIVSVIDNMIKGASGQAVQNMNVMFNLKESEGLIRCPYYP